MGEDEIRHELRQQREMLQRIDRTIHGSESSAGLRTRIALMEQWVEAANKLVWLLVSAALTAAGSALFVALQALL